jgi:hypothetical protein
MVRASYSSSKELVRKVDHEEGWVHVLENNNNVSFTRHGVDGFLVNGKYFVPPENVWCVGVGRRVRQ